MFVGLLLLAAMQPAVIAEGQGACPAAAQVQQRLADLMAAVPDDVEQDRARLATVGDGLEIHLVREDGTTIARRLIPGRGQGSCADLASATAVVIATWEAQLRPQRLRREVLPTGTAAASVRQPAAAPAGQGTRFDVGVGAAGVLAGGRLVPGGVLTASVGGGLGAWAALSAAAQREDFVADTGGTTKWTRIALTLGPRLRLVRGRAIFDGYAGAAGGLLLVSASGLQRNASQQSFEVGVAGGVRLLLAQSIGPWVALDVHGWPRRDYLAVEGITGRLELPQVEVRLAVGVSLGRYP